jgi:flagellar FliL protein
VQDKYRDKRGKNGEEKEKENAASQPRKAKKYLFIVLGAIVILILLGGALTLKLGLASNLLGNLQGEQNQENVIKEPEFMYEVPEIVVNLNGIDRRRFLSVKFYLGFDEPKLEQELEKRMPEIRDGVNKILWVKTADEINTPEGKETLREEIFETINGMLNSGKLRGVYFWHLMIQ